MRVAPAADLSEAPVSVAPLNAEVPAVAGETADYSVFSHAACSAACNDITNGGGGGGERSSAQHLLFSLFGYRWRRWG